MVTVFIPLTCKRRLITSAGYTIADTIIPENAPKPIEASGERMTRLDTPPIFSFFFKILYTFGTSGLRMYSFPVP